jgi:hypothetical protein
MFAPAVHLRSGESLRRAWRAGMTARSHEVEHARDCQVNHGHVRTAFDDPVLSARKGPDFIA